MKDGESMRQLGKDFQMMEWSTAEVMINYFANTYSDKYNIYKNAHTRFVDGMIIHCWEAEQTMNCGYDEKR